MCGDHYCSNLLNTLNMGSPPHVRGPPPALFMSFLGLGITPACAGTTFDLETIESSYRDHPRMCGDHSALRSSMRFSPGSPPHVRGPLVNSFCAKDCAGITPACAGTTFYWNICYFHSWDHPRMCGDHSKNQARSLYMTGSPPHVRGPLYTCSLLLLTLGITPACAGTTI